MTNTRRINKNLLNDPFFIGFDNIFNKMNYENVNKNNYPPYNLIKTGDGSYLIEIAVAGFDEDDFDIELHEGVLSVRAEVNDDGLDAEYLHKGIAARSFERKFTLANTVKVTHVSLHMGMLTIRLQNVIPEDKKPKKIPIGRQLDTEFLTE